jgi:oligosaccharyltransferase complex subunit gamma
MKLLSLITAALLPLTALAAKKPTGDLFQKYNAKQLSASGSFKLDDKTYGQLTKAPRDYSVAVLLTALEARFGCGLCNDFQPEYDLLARSWTKGDKAGEGRLLFATLDFLDGKATFQSVCGHVSIVMAITVLTYRNRCNSRLRPSYFSSTRLLDPMRRPTRLLLDLISLLGELSRLCISV